MAESTITAKGQTTVPVEIRKHFGIKTGTRLAWYAMPDGTIMVRAKTLSLLDLAGTIKLPKGKRLTMKDMNGWR